VTVPLWPAVIKTLDYGKGDKDLAYYNIIEYQMNVDYTTNCFYDGRIINQKS
jgi:hypothetical protein